MTTQPSSKEPLYLIFDDWIREVKKDLHKRGSFWTPTLISQAADARTVVLRSLESSPTQASSFPLFVVHTDVRSKKWRDLHNNPSCVLHFYCSKRKWQMRLNGIAQLHAQDSFAESQWQQLSGRSQQIYSLKLPPGVPVEDPQQAYCFDEDHSAYRNFGVIGIQANKFESLQLERPDRTDYHVRARWDLASNNYSYLAP